MDLVYVILDVWTYEVVDWCQVGGRLLNCFTPSTASLDTLNCFRLDRDGLSETAVSSCSSSCSSKRYSSVLHTAPLLGVPRQLSIGQS